MATTDLKPKRERAGGGKTKRWTRANKNKAVRLAMSNGPKKLSNNSDWKVRSGHWAVRKRTTVPDTAVSPEKRFLTRS